MPFGGLYGSSDTCLWILGTFSCVCDPEEHILYPAAGLLHFMWMPIMSWAREFIVCLSSVKFSCVCKLLQRDQSEDVALHLDGYLSFIPVTKRKCLGLSVFIGSHACCNLAVFFGVVLPPYNARIFQCSVVAQPTLCVHLWPILVLLIF